LPPSGLICRPSAGWTTYGTGHADFHSFRESLGDMQSSSGNVGQSYIVTAFEL
jgi:hypothetical protein